MPNLPGSLVDQDLNATLPALPATSGPSEPVPAAWSDPVNIMRQVLDVLACEGKPAAASLIAWLNSRKQK